MPYNISFEPFVLMLLKPILLNRIKLSCGVMFNIYLSIWSGLKSIEQILFTIVSTKWEMQRHICFKIFFFKQVFIYAFGFLLLKFVFKRLLSFFLAICGLNFHHFNVCLLPEDTFHFLSQLRFFISFLFSFFGYNVSKDVFLDQFFILFSLDVVSELTQKVSGCYFGLWS